MRAFVLVKVKGYDEDELIRKITSKHKDSLMKIVSEKSPREYPVAFSLAGIHDVIFGIDVSDEERLREIVVDMRKSEGVTKTLTMIVL